VEAEKWVNLLFTYGPYAVLALFALWVAPRQTKLFLGCVRDGAAARTLCGAVAAGSWLIVAAMVVLIWRSWPPDRV
jgi:hypothetical protein